MSSQALVRYRTNDYSVPVAYGHRDVWIRGYVDGVVIGCGGNIIARHPRCYGREDMVFDPVHYLPLNEKKIGALGSGDIATVFGRAFELAMQIERERFLRAGPYERTAERQGYANGYKPKRIDTPAGTVTVDVPKTAGHDGAPFYPQSLEHGRRSVRAVMLAVAEMDIKGVSTRKGEPLWRRWSEHNGERGDARVRHQEPVLLAGQPRGEASR